MSDAGLRTTMDRLLGPARLGKAQRVAARTRRLAATRGPLCLYVGATFPAAAPTWDPANLWIHPTLDFDRNLSAFDANLDAAFPFLYISFPSAKDLSFEARYPNRHVIEVVTLASYEHFSCWAGSDWRRRPVEYELTKKRLADRLLAELYLHVPAAAGTVTTWELSTPLSTQQFDSAPRGEMVRSRAYADALRVARSWAAYADSQPVSDRPGCRDVRGDGCAIGRCCDRLRDVGTQHVRRGVEGRAT